MTKDLLLAAFPPELAGLDRRPPPGWSVACTGIGALAAAIATTRLIQALRPSRVLFVGTCGAYDPDLSIGDLRAASEAIATSLDELHHRAYRPTQERTRWASTWKLPFPELPVAVPPAITATDEGAATLGHLADLEHLEITGVFAAAHAASVPVAALLGVANRVGPAAHEEWKRNHAQVSARLIAALEPVFLPR